jgi:hypothetical protein
MILELQPIKTAVLQPPNRRFVRRKTARAGYKITNFGTGSGDFKIAILKPLLMKKYKIPA